jgi:cytochrome P450
LELQKPVLEGYAKKFNACLRKAANDNEGIVDMTTWLNCLTIDIIGDLSFGEDFGSLDAGDLQPRLQMLFKAIKQFTFVKEFLRLPSLLAMTFLGVMSAAVTPRGIAIKDVGADAMAKRRTRPDVERPDMVSYMLAHARTKGAGYLCSTLVTRPVLLTRYRMTPREVDKAALTFMIAGSETST